MKHLGEAKEEIESVFARIGEVQQVSLERPEEMLVQLNVYK